MLVNFVTILFQTIFYLVIFKISTIISISYIWGTFNTKLNLFQGIIQPATNINIFSSFVYYLFFIKKISLTRLPSIISSSIFYFHKKNNKLFSILSFLILSISLLIGLLFTKIPSLFFLGWIFAIILLLIKNNNLLINSFVTAWLAHSVGTLTNYFFIKELSVNEYILLTPISWCERIAITIIIFVSYKIFILLNKILKRNIKNIYSLILKII